MKNTISFLLLIFPGYVFWILLQTWLALYRERIKISLESGYKTTLSFLLFSFVIIIISIGLSDELALERNAISQLIELKFSYKFIVTILLVTIVLSSILAVPQINKILLFMFNHRDDSSARALDTLTKKSPFWLFTLKNDKVYLIMPDSIDGYPEDSGSFGVEVYASGYRDKESRKVFFTERYFEYEDENSEQEPEFNPGYIVIPEREIASIAHYDLIMKPVLLEEEDYRDKSDPSEDSHQLAFPIL